MKTVKDLKKLIKDLPDNMPIQFSPINMIWFEDSYPLRAESIEIYAEDGFKSSNVKDPTAQCVVYLHGLKDE